MHNRYEVVSGTLLIRTLFKLVRCLDFGVFHELDTMSCIVTLFIVTGGVVYEVDFIYS